jgi:hypothetical protein
VEEKARQLAAAASQTAAPLLTGTTTTTTTPSSSALPTRRQLDAAGVGGRGTLPRRGGGPRDIPREFDVNPNQPSAVPQEEEVTLATDLKTRAIAIDEESQASPTVASSTVGEERQKVKHQSLLDPYGDRGVYTGTVLRSTGMPHGMGRMIYEDDGRTYEGDWRHGKF